MNGSHLIREARHRAGLSQRQLADRVGTTQSAIARVESGDTAPSLERISSLVQACGFELELKLRVADDHDWSMVARNLELSPDERLRNVINAANFTLATREAMAAAHGA
jgi:transcriptional regulator with XRE-family HTH domain